MMFRLLLKKQLYEVFRSYFYDSRKNKARSKGSVIFMFVVFALLMLFLAGTFLMMSFALCAPLCDANYGWLYYCIIGSIALVVGIFGSAFGTYNMLYVSKDNEFLLSMPIPIRAIAASRAVSVYLLGMLYSGIVLIPAYIVYFITTGEPRAIPGVISFSFVIFTVIFSLSCLLGWLIAKIGRRIKNKSIVSAVLLLAVIALYYYAYFKAQTLIASIVENSSAFGEKIRGSAYFFYMFGAMGEGDPVACAIYIAAAAVLLILVWILLRTTFFGIATSGSAVKKTVYREKAVKANSADRALLGKEARRLTSSTIYMLNCSIASLFLFIVGGIMLWRGAGVVSMIVQAAEDFKSVVTVAVCAITCLVSTMNSIAAMSVSLEGKNLWIVRSMPVSSDSVLTAKLRLHLLVTGIPMLFCSVCAAVIVDESIWVRILIVALCMLFMTFVAIGELLIGLRFAELDWTNETTVIKQSRCTVICLFGSWGLALLTGLPYLLVFRFMSAGVYLGIFTALYAAGVAALYACLKKHGASMFEKL